MGLFDKFSKSVKHGKNDITKISERKEHLLKLIKANSSLSFKSSYDRNIELLLKKVGESRIAFKSLSPFSEKEGSIINVVYEFSGNRFRFETKVISYDDKTGIIISSLPSVIRDNERRKEKRVIIPNRARFLVKVIPDFSGRIGFSGDIHNLSTHGLSLNIDRVMDIKSEKGLQINQKMFEGIKQLQIIRFGQEGSTEIEASGNLIYVVKLGVKYRAGIEFNKTAGNSLRLIEAYLSKFR
jgi:hypothetical protein